MPSLGFRIQKQQHTDWCWAAVASSVDHYFNPRSKWCQCRVAGRMAKMEKLGVTCGTCGKRKRISEKCNRPWDLEKALKIVSRLKGRKKNSFLSFAQIQKTIGTGRPVCVMIQWGRSQMAHFVVISGCATGRHGEHWVDVADPFVGSSTWLYEEFRSNYQHHQGRWIRTYFTA